MFWLEDLFALAAPLLLTTVWAPARDIPKGAGMRALVVDDAASMRAILRRTLQERGFEVVTASRGSEALNMMSETTVDLVTIDWNMPEMTGFELLQKIRQDPTYAPIKVIMVTTETNKAEMTHALAAGANEYIMKPFTPDAVYDKLRLVGLPLANRGDVARA
jgi:two-component system chemotaxis response regulator CheY